MKLRYIFSGIVLTALTALPAAAQDDELLEAKVLTPAGLQHKGLVVTGAFDGWKVLHLLFPGNYYHAEGKEMINWTCPACDSQQYWDANSQYYNAADSERYPDKEGLATRLLKVYSAKTAAGEYRWLAFYHSAFDVDGAQMGRFNGGLLGIAQFRRKGNGWVLQSLNPAIGAYGAFDQCPTPELIAIGENQYGFLLTHANGGAGSPYDGDMALVADDNGQYRQRLFAICISQYNTMTENSWASRLSVLPGRKRFRDIRITTTGEYTKDDNWSIAPCGLTKYFARQQRCSFTITIRYVYRRGKGYQPSGRPVITKH